MRISGRQHFLVSVETAHGDRGRSNLFCHVSITTHSTKDTYGIIGKKKKGRPLTLRNLCTESSEQDIYQVRGINIEPIIPPDHSQPASSRAST